jgi:predicted transposase YdaD
VHYLQGKTELVKATELLALLTDFHRDKLAMRQRHVAVAKYVPDYDFNNTYQYVIAREDVQLNWLRDAITDLGGALEDLPEPSIDVSGKDRDLQAELIAADERDAQGFVDSWRTRIEGMPNARHRSLLRVILGETLEHKRFFQQALAGRSDLLGRRADGAGTPGEVLGVRWIER